MGLRNWLRDKHMKDPVEGTLQVTGASMAPQGAMYSNCRLHGVLTAPGVPAMPVEHYLTAPVNKWPDPGVVLPVTVDRADPTRLRVNWDDVPSNREVAAALTQQFADAVRTGRFNAEPPAVYKAPGRPLPGAPGGGLTPEQSAELIADGGGEEASAVVVAAHEVFQPADLPSAPGGVVDITLDITRGDGSGYTAVNRVSFSTLQRREQIAVVGTRVPVRLDPDDPTRVVIDSSKLF
jgi:hypothetical protein